ncbi:Hypothetical predicted protein [Mytilus galloprovincialis]|uniref:DZANK-type domain-containing protein n=1 Tax=Mytilus galloprovincialis TaxID=29158 RepID=A0A8B6F858_MYTGA|nr:Hypothetical predicted protein [Mytilus galloprovincialis]
METEDKSVGLRRLLQACVVLFEIYPRMLQDMISNNFSSVIKVDEMIKKSGKNFKKHFNPTESRIIDNIRTDGFRKMDSSLLYKLIRHFELVEKPSSGWDNKPKVSAIKQGDDVQRLRSLRNSTFHTLTATMTEQENETFFSVFLQCADRLDRDLKRSQMTENFTEEIKKVKLLDDSNLQPYNKKFEDTEKMQEEASWGNKTHIVELYYKKALREEIENNENKKDGPTHFIVEIIGEVDADTVVEILQQGITLLNERGCKIKVSSVRKGSVVLLVSIGYMAFASTLALQEQMKLFVNRVLGITDIGKWMKRDLRIMLIPIDYIVSLEHDHTIQCEECQVTLKPDAQFCHECGTEIVERQIFCSDCNGAVIEEHNFCPHCGNQRRQDTDAVETTADHNDEHNAHAQNTSKEEVNFEARPAHEIDLLLSYQTCS